METIAVNRGRELILGTLAGLFILILGGVTGLGWRLPVSSKSPQVCPRQTDKSLEPWLDVTMV